MRSWRLGVIRGEVAAWCLVMSCTCWGPWGSHRGSEHPRRAQLLICWGWLAGKFFASDRRWDDASVRAVRTWKDLQINSSSHRAHLMLCCSCSDHRGWHLRVMPRHPEHTSPTGNRILGEKDHDIMLLGLLLRKWFTNKEVGEPGVAVTRGPSLAGLLPRTELYGSYHYLLLFSEQTFLMFFKVFWLWHIYWCCRVFSSLSCVWSKLRGTEWNWGSLGHDRFDVIDKSGF